MERFLKSKFKIGGKINENPFSLTYKGTTLSGEVPVIIKIYKRGNLNSALIKNMKQKVRALSEINHPGLSRLMDGDYGWQGFYYVREYLEGVTLKEYLKARRLDLFEAEKIMLQISEALRIVHEKGIIHGALKLTNVFLDRDRQVKLADFVIEGEIKEALPQKVQLLFYSDPSLSPEEILGSPASPASDIYNLGLILMEMARGEPLAMDFNSQVYKAKTLPALPAGLPRYLEEILMKCLQPDPLLRFKSVSDFIESLKHHTLMESSETADWPQLSLENAPRAEEREIKIIKTERKRSFFLLIVVLLAALAGVIYSLINSYFLRQ